MYDMHLTTIPLASCVNDEQVDGDPYFKRDAEDLHVEVPVTVSWHCCIYMDINCWVG